MVGTPANGAFGVDVATSVAVRRRGRRTPRRRRSAWGRPPRRPSITQRASSRGRHVLAAHQLGEAGGVVRRELVQTHGAEPTQGSVAAPGRWERGSTARVVRADDGREAAYSVMARPHRDGQRRLPRRATRGRTGPWPTRRRRARRGHLHAPSTPSPTARPASPSASPPPGRRTAGGTCATARPRALSTSSAAGRSRRTCPSCSPTYDRFVGGGRWG